MGKSKEAKDKMNKLARDVLVLSRNTLLVNLRFLDAALSQFEFVPWDEGTLATSGKYLFYNPRYVLVSYSVEKEIPVRDYLHVIMHCVFQHMYGAPKLNQALWNLACDIAVEYTISGLGLKAATVRRERDELPVFSQIESAVGDVTAEKVYRYFLDNDLPEEKMKELRKLFKGDDHEAWYYTESDKRVILKKAGAGSDQDNPSGEEQEGDEDEDGEREDERRSQGDDTGYSDNDVEGKMNAQARAAQAQIWKEIGERMQQEVRIFNNGRFGDAGSLVQNLQEVNREKYNYESFLRKFMTHNEVMKINDDEFDYIFYTYGLSIYKKMPLVEPLEYKDAKRIRDFVIAIDTSGSVAGDIVQKFVQKTYNVMKSEETFTKKFNLHIIQCDASVQEDVKITCQEEFDEYLRTMKLKGFGGNNEEELFRHIEVLRENKQFHNLKGMIYFTDGYGIFPKDKPDYDVAFVFVENDRYPIPDDLPSWVIKIVLRDYEI